MKSTNNNTPIVHAVHNYTVANCSNTKTVHR